MAFDPNPQTEDQLLSEGVEDMLRQPWAEVPPEPTELPVWAGKETVRELIADYRAALRDMQKTWLSDAISGGMPSEETMASTTAHIRVAEIVRMDLLRILDHAKPDGS